MQYGPITSAIYGKQDVAGFFEKAAANLEKEQEQAAMTFIGKCVKCNRPIYQTKDGWIKYTCKPGTCNG